jgi:hypothetical protein
MAKTKEPNIFEMDLKAILEEMKKQQDIAITRLNDATEALTESREASGKVHQCVSAIPKALLKSGANPDYVMSLL